MADVPFLPDAFAVPVRHTCGPFHLEPLGPRHHESDHVAWSTSIEHIHATPGFRTGEWDDDPWPYEMSPEQNLADLVAHVDEFARREAFAYTVLDDAGHVIGCVYVEPDGDGPTDGGAAPAKVRSWVRHDLAHLDDELARCVRDWLRGAWPFTEVRFPGRW